MNKIITLIIAFWLVALAHSKIQNKNNTAFISIISNRSSISKPLIQSQKYFNLIPSLLRTITILILLKLVYDILQKYRKKRRMKQVFTEYQLSKATLNHQLSPQICTLISKNFTTQKWQMNILYDIQFIESYTSDIRFETIEKVNDYKYNITLIGLDKYGQSVMKGLLLFYSDKIGLILLKQYKNTNFYTFQTHSQQILISQNIQNIGKWSYTSYQNDPRYSGLWTLQPIQ